MTATHDDGLHAQTRHLHYGPWSLELRGDELANIRHADRLVLRGIRAVVRNHNWLTLTPHVTHEEIAPLPGCELRLTIRWDGHGAEYKGELTLSFSDTALEVEFNGTAVKDFRSNRIGLIVLHGPDNAGIPCEVTSPDGGKLSSAFPLGISPHQPFKNVAALAWERDQVRYRLDFDGDVFETEDQRNWTDASFKTYSTPLERPFPVNNRPGDHVRQAVRLSVKHRIDITDTVTGSVPELGTATGVEDGDVRPRTLPATFGPLLAEVSARPNAAFATISPAEA